jgi:L-malate glycosyltransferase
LNPTLRDSILKPVVLQLIDSFHQGGSERQALQLTRLLRQNNRYDVRLACLSPDGVLRATIADLELGDIPAFPLTAFYNSQGIAQVRRFARYVKENQIQVLHTHDFYTNVFGMFGGAFARVPVRIASMRETGGMRTAGQKRMQRFAYSLAHHVVANSESVRAELLRQGLADDKISVIYNGIDEEREAAPSPSIRGDALTRLGLFESLDGQNHFVTIVANMRHEVKDYPLFLRAARRVREAVPNAAFLLAGEGELMPSLRAMARDLGLENSVHFLGRCDKLADLLSISDVCVLSSRAEGFSNSILEYMAAGRPVVATDVGGAREAIIEGVTGYLVPPREEQLLAERIIDLLRSNRAAEMGNAGKQIVAEKFSLAAQLEKTLSLYDRLIAERPRKAR